MTFEDIIAALTTKLGVNADKTTQDKLWFGDEVGGISINLVRRTYFDFSDESSGPLEALAERLGIAPATNGHDDDPPWEDQGDLVGFDEERALLGILFLRPDVAEWVFEEIGPSDFGADINRDLFATFSAAIDAGESFTVASALASLTAKGWDKREPAPGFALGSYIARLASDVRLSASPDDVPVMARDLARQICKLTTQEFRAPSLWVPPFGLLMWSDRHQPGKEVDYLIEDMVPESALTLIIGESGSGKSFATTDMLMCGARGVPFFGRRVLKPFGSVYCAYETGNGYPDRLRALERHYNLKAEDLPFAVFRAPPELWHEPKNVGALIEGIKGVAQNKFGDVRLGAVAIDTHNAATPGASEIDSEVVSKIRTRYHSVIDQTGAALLLVSHKNAAGKHRGNEQLYNNAPTVIDVSMKVELIERKLVQVKDAAGHDLRTMTIRKQRDRAAGAKWDFILRSVEVGRMDKYGKVVTSCVVTPPSEGAEAAPSQSRAYALPPGWIDLRPNARMVFKALVDALRRVGTHPPPGNRAPHGATCVRWGDWNEELLRQRRELANETGRPEERAKADRLLKAAVGKAIKDAREKWSPRLIGFDEGWYWRTDRKVAGVDEASKGADMPPPVPEDEEIPE